MQVHVLFLRFSDTEYIREGCHSLFINAKSGCKTDVKDPSAKDIAQ
jgi:hypothetical protein